MVFVKNCSNSHNSRRIFDIIRLGFEMYIVVKEDNNG